ncbi:MAG: energy transducer TonB [Burkholderiaceae bacterium]
MALAQHHDRARLIKSLLLISVVGLHAALLAGILASARVTLPIKAPEPADVRFVEISPDIGQEAAAQTPASALAAPAPESQPAPEPRAEPEPTPPAPEQPAADAITLPLPEIAPEPVAQPVAQPQPKPEIKPKPKPKPRPKPKGEPKHQPQPELKSALPKPGAAQAPTGAAAQGAAVATTAPASKSDSNQPRLIGTVDYLGSRPHPDYPRVSMRRGETGRVVVRVFISRQGLVEKATVRTSSGFSRLDESAVNAVRAARFKPYTENGVPYPAIADIPFDFVL